MIQDFSCFWLHELRWRSYGAGWIPKQDRCQPAHMMGTTHMVSHPCVRSQAMTQVQSQSQSVPSGLKFAGEKELHCCLVRTFAHRCRRGLERLAYCRHTRTMSGVHACGPLESPVAIMMTIECTSSAARLPKSFAALPDFYWMSKHLRRASGSEWYYLIH